MSNKCSDCNGFLNYGGEYRSDEIQRRFVNNPHEKSEIDMVLLELNKKTTDINIYICAECNELTLRFKRAIDFILEEASIYRKNEIPDVL